MEYAGQRDNSYPACKGDSMRFHHTTQNIRQFKTHEVYFSYFPFNIFGLSWKVKSQMRGDLLCMYICVRGV